MAIQQQLSNLLQAEGSPPYVTLVLPLIPTVPGRLQNKTHFQALCKEATEKLLGNTTPRARQVSERLNRFAQTIDLNHSSAKGVALLVGAQHELVIPLYSACSPAAHVGTVFSLQAIIHSAQHNPRFWVLTLSKQYAHLFLYENRSLQQIITPPHNDAGLPLQGFPLNSLTPEDKFKQAAGQGDRGARYFDAEVEKFFRLVDGELHSMQTTHDNLPVIVCAKPEYITLFTQISHHKNSLILQVPHDYDAHQRTVEKLHTDVQNAVDRYLNTQEQELLTEFQEAINHRKQACTAVHVWEMVSTGRVHKLLLEPNLSEMGRINPDLPANLQIFEHTANDTLDSVADILIHQTLSHGGTVHMVQSGSLKACKGYGAILRY